MTYDRLDWHYDSAIEAGQPPENAFTHIGLFLAWLIRHDLHDSRVFPPAHVAAVKSGEMTGSDLADDIDTKFNAADVNDEGRAFSDARYGAYLAELERVMSDEPAYSLIDDAAAYERIAPVIDGLYAAWLADGRPGPPSGVAADSDAIAMASIATETFSFEVDSIERDTVRPHVAPDLEALLPGDLTSPPLEVWSVKASDWGSSLLRRALKRLGVRAVDARVAIAMGGRGDETLVVTLYAVPGTDREQLEAEFADAITLPPRGRWTSRDVAGRTVRWATGEEFTVAFWATDGLVVHVAGRADLVEAAIPRLP